MLLHLGEMTSHLKLAYPIITPKSYLTFIVLNILSLGIYSYKENAAKSRRVHELQRERDKLLTDVNSYSLNLNKLEKDLRTVWERTLQSEKNEESLESYTSRLKQLATQKNAFVKPSKRKPAPFRFNLKECITQMFFTIITLGYRGTLQYVNLKNQITILKAQNAQILQQIGQQKDMERVQNLIEMIVGVKRNKKILGEKFNKLSDVESQLGLLPFSRYIKRPEDDVILGAFEIEEDKHGKGTVAYAHAYQKRYRGKCSAAEIVRAGFDYAFAELLKMANRGTKVKINDSYETASSEGSEAVYNYMILDWIKGGTLKQNVCRERFELALNEHILMYRGQPERVLKRESSGDGRNDELRVALQYKEHDEFTPTTERLLLSGGVDIVSAKWIYAQLDHEEKQHLVNLLIEKVIEDNHDEYQQTIKYMQRTNNPRVKLVQTAYDLIWNVSVAIQEKFKAVLNEAWKASAKNKVKKAFVKERMVLLNINQNDNYMAPTKKREWQPLDENVLGSHNEQPEFFSLMSVAQFKYKTIFKHLPDILLHRVKGKKFENITWEEINIPNYVTHQMIAVKEDGHGGARCLFSNLLAALVTDKKDLTLDNVRKLLKAMAAYLDKLQWAKREWEKLSDKNSKTRSPSLEELYLLAIHFEQAVKNCHQCSLQDYQKWLRQEKGELPRINANDLTTLEVELCAYTLGVKIGVLAVSVHQTGSWVKCPAETDEYERIVPCQFYGFDTDVYYLLVSNNESFYAAFPRLIIDKTKYTNDEYEDMNKIEHYWRSIAMNQKVCV